MQSTSPADYEAAVATMAMAPVRLTLAALPVMRAQGHGRIVTITSIGGKLSVATSCTTARTGLRFPACTQPTAKASAHTATTRTPITASAQLRRRGRKWPLRYADGRPR